MIVALKRSTPLLMGFAFTSFAVYYLMRSPTFTAGVKPSSAHNSITITDQYHQKDLESSELMREILARHMQTANIPAIKAQLLVEQGVLVDSTATTKILDYRVRLCVSNKQTLTTTIRADDVELPDQIKEKAVVEFSRILAGQLTAHN